MSLLANLDVKKSVGPDGLSAFFLKKVVPEIVSPLTLLYNKSMSSGTIPIEWKKYNVHKSGTFDDPGNFGPISVVPIIEKLLEKIVAYQLNLYFDKNHLLFNYQGVYRRGRSTEQLLLTATDTIVNAIDNKAITCVAFLDLRKAFDSLDHVILL